MKVKVEDIAGIIEGYFPLHLAESWDNCGLQLGSLQKEISRLGIALDMDAYILEQALELHVDLVITHHPLFFRPFKKIDYSSPEGKILKTLINSDISVYSAHTNADAGEKGLNQLLADTLGLKNIQALSDYKKESLYKLVVFVPAGHVQRVRQAINDAGAGSMGNYSDCSFRTEGTGTFKPGKTSTPYIGHSGVLEEVHEYRLETIVSQFNLTEVIKAMLHSHPYEEVAYDIYRLENEGKVFSMGRKGILAKAKTLEEFAIDVKKALKLDDLRVAGDLDKKVARVAVISGAGSSLLKHLKSGQIDVVVTGDLKYHEAREITGRNLGVIDAGHQGTEQIFVAYLAEIISRECRAKNLKAEVLELTSSPCFKTL